MNRRQLLKGLVAAAVAAPVIALAAREAIENSGLPSPPVDSAVLDVFMAGYGWRTVGYRWEVIDDDGSIAVRPVYSDEVFENSSMPCDEDGCLLERNF